MTPDEALKDLRRVSRADQKKLAWCIEHRDLAWIYSDGSAGCWYCCVVEQSSSECEVVVLRITR